MDIKNQYENKDLEWLNELQREKVLSENSDFVYMMLNTYENDKEDYYDISEGLIYACPELFKYAPDYIKCNPNIAAFAISKDPLNYAYCNDLVKQNKLVLDVYKTMTHQIPYKDSLFDRIRKITGTNIIDNYSNNIFEDLNYCKYVMETNPYNIQYIPAKNLALITNDSGLNLFKKGHINKKTYFETVMSKNSEGKYNYDNFENVCNAIIETQDTEIIKMYSEEIKKKNPDIAKENLLQLAATIPMKITLNNEKKRFPQQILWKSISPELQNDKDFQRSYLELYNKRLCEDQNKDLNLSPEELEKVIQEEMKYVYELISKQFNNDISEYMRAIGLPVKELTLEKTDVKSKSPLEMLEDFYIDFFKELDIETLDTNLKKDFLKEYILNIEKISKGLTIKDDLSEDIKNKINQKIENFSEDKINEKINAFKDIKLSKNLRPLKESWNNLTFEQQLDEKTMRNFYISYFEEVIKLENISDDLKIRIVETEKESAKKYTKEYLIEKLSNCLKVDFKAIESVSIKDKILKKWSEESIHSQQKKETKLKYIKEFLEEEVRETKPDKTFPLSFFENLEIERKIEKLKEKSIESLTELMEEKGFKIKNLNNILEDWNNLKPEEQMNRSVQYEYLERYTKLDGSHEILKMVKNNKNFEEFLKVLGFEFKTLEIQTDKNWNDLTFEEQQDKKLQLKYFEKYLEKEYRKSENIKIEEPLPEPIRKKIESDLKEIEQIDEKEFLDVMKDCGFKFKTLEKEIAPNQKWNNLSYKEQQNKETQIDYLVKQFEFSYREYKGLSAETELSQKDQKQIKEFKENLKNMTTKELKIKMESTGFEFKNSEKEIINETNASKFWNNLSYKEQQKTENQIETIRLHMKEKCKEKLDLKEYEDLPYFVENRIEKELNKLEKENKIKETIESYDLKFKEKTKEIDKETIEL